MGPSERRDQTLDDEFGDAPERETAPVEQQLIPAIDELRPDHAYSWVALKEIHQFFNTPFQNQRVGVEEQHVLPPAHF